MKSIWKVINGVLGVCVVGALCLTATNVYADLLSNPGFEDPVTSDGPPFVGFWGAFSGGAGASSANSSVDPLSGVQHLALEITYTVNTFAGVFQDVPALSAGQILTWSGWAKDVGADAGGSEIRIEWRDSVNDVEISRTGNLVPTLTTDYTQWAVVDTVPAGADLARVVYAIQSFGAGPDQTVYVDDTSVTVVPEPGSLVLLGLGGMALVLRRRRACPRGRPRGPIN